MLARGEPGTRFRVGGRRGGYLSAMADQTEKKKVPFAATLLFLLMLVVLLMLVIGIVVL